MVSKCWKMPSLIFYLYLYNSHALIKKVTFYIPLQIKSINRTQGHWPGLFVLISFWFALESVFFTCPFFTWPLAFLSVGMGRGVVASFPWGLTREGLQPMSLSFPQPLILFSLLFLSISLEWISISVDGCSPFNYQTIRTLTNPAVNCGYLALWWSV